MLLIRIKEDMQYPKKGPGIILILIIMVLIHMTDLPRKWTDAVAKFGEDILKATWHCTLACTNNAVPA